MCCTNKHGNRHNPVYLPEVCLESGPSQAAFVLWRSHPGPHSLCAVRGHLPGSCGGCETVSGSELKLGQGSSHARREVGRAPVLHPPSLHTDWVRWPSGQGLLWSTSLGTAWSSTRQRTYRFKSKDSHNCSKGFFSCTSLEQRIKSLDNQGRCYTNLNNCSLA